MAQGCSSPVLLLLDTTTLILLGYLFPPLLRYLSGLLHSFDWSFVSYLSTTLPLPDRCSPTTLLKPFFYTAVLLLHSYLMLLCLVGCLCVLPCTYLTRSLRQGYRKSSSRLCDLRKAASPRSHPCLNIGHASSAEETDQGFLRSRKYVVYSQS